MRKLIVLFAFLALATALGFYAKSLVENQGKSDTELIEFAIKDTSSVDKIIITDAYSNRIELLRHDKIWSDSKGECITQENVHYILDAFKNIEFKAYLAKEAQANFNKRMIAQHTKVEIFQHGEWVKTWYIGPPSQDHYGQIMLLDSEEDGKSDIPVMMSIRGTKGIIEPRFFADSRSWKCTNIFAVPLERISKVDVKIMADPKLSFSVTKVGSILSVFQAGKKLENVDNGMIFRYLQSYKKIHFDLANFELNERQVDSVKHAKPFSTISLTETTGKKTNLRLFTLKSNEPTKNEYGEVLNIDYNKFWCQLPNGDLVKCQYFVFDPLLKGHLYFPFDLKGTRLGALLSQQ
ncbi:MAG: hypothetical protein KA521_03305 [Crocinitomicaceae bacterium]|nr:hypothetical protein [Crocinitomicaceae bacterium]